jgi:hypothetical protein
MTAVANPTAWDVTDDADQSHLGRITRNQIGSPPVDSFIAYGVTGLYVSASPTLAEAVSALDTNRTDTHARLLDETLASLGTNDVLKAQIRTLLSLPVPTIPQGPQGTPIIPPIIPPFTPPALPGEPAPAVPAPS